MLADPDACRSLVHQLMSVGKDIRSTPMAWAYEGKKLDAGVKFLSWRPPWVIPRPGDRGAVGVERDEQVRLLGESTACPLYKSDVVDHLPC